VGSVSVPTYQLIGGAVDVKLKSRTYFGIQAESLQSDVNREYGVFEYGTNVPPLEASVLPSATPQTLNYEERSVLVTLNQLLSDAWSIGTEYRYTQSQLHTLFPDVATAVNPAADRTEQANLHQNNLFVLYNHPSGFFARAEAQWYHQDNFGYSPALPSSDFWQENIYVGYRLKRQKGELTFGVLNLGNTDYHLNPLNLYSELPRERVFLVRLKINL
jgi:hypothetical protein